MLFGLPQTTFLSSGTSQQTNNKNKGTTKSSILAKKIKDDVNPTIARRQCHYCFDLTALTWFECVSICCLLTHN